MVWMDARESLVLLVPREKMELLEPLEVLVWLAHEVCPVREVVLALLVLLELVVLMAMLDPLALLALLVLLDPLVFLVVPVLRERLDLLEVLAQVDLRDQEESQVPMVLLALSAPLVTLVLMA